MGLCGENELTALVALPNVNTNVNILRVTAVCEAELNT